MAALHQCTVPPFVLHLATGRASFAYIDLNGAELWHQERELLNEVLEATGCPTTANRGYTTYRK